MDIVKIEGHDLVRDMTSGAVLNKNVNEFESFRNKKLKEKEASMKIERLERLLHEMIEKINLQDKLLEKALNNCITSKSVGKYDS